MVEMLTNAAVEQRNNGYYVSGTRVSLDSVAWALKRGESVDEILADFPAIGARQRLEASVAFIDAHPREIEAYLTAGAQAWEEARKLNPQELIERARSFAKGMSRSRRESAPARGRGSASCHNPRAPAIGTAG
jgi:uncharacterized protein (DUF433 family)